MKTYTEHVMNASLDGMKDAGRPGATAPIMHTKEFSKMDKLKPSETQMIILEILLEDLSKVWNENELVLETVRRQEQRIFKN